MFPYKLCILAFIFAILMNSGVHCVWNAIFGDEGTDTLTDMLSGPVREGAKKIVKNLFGSGGKDSGSSGGNSGLFGSLWDYFGEK